MPTRRAPWWMFIVAASFLAYVSVVFYQTFWGPNLLGIDLEFVAGKGVVVATHGAGLQPGDRILAVDGQTIHNAYDWNVIDANKEVGRPERLEIARGDRRVQVEQTFGRVARGQLRRDDLLHLTYLGLVLVSFATSVVI